VIACLPGAIPEAVALGPDDGPITLRLTGPDGTREFVDAELPNPGT